MAGTSEIRAYRERTGVTRAELSKRLGGLHRSTLCKWENGTRIPEPRYWLALNREIGIPLCKLAPSIAEAQEEAANVS